ncbi:MAG: phosphoribosylglycinamide formyltransferase [Eubacteriales bacterium]|nr:phosphoribosylglycinamide formyltransferase [Eubacteriales bacterium]
MQPVKIAVMASGGGTNFQAIIDACASGEICGQIVGLIYNRKAAYACQRAQDAGIPATYINKKRAGSVEAFSSEILAALKECGAELVVLAGWLEILGDAVVEAYPNRIINIHPALIPSFCGKGFYGHYVHEAVLAYGAKLSGCTVHFVSAVADGGPIILQEAVPVLPNDDADSLAARILPHEHENLVKAVRLYCQGKLRVDGRVVHIEE